MTGPTSPLDGAWDREDLLAVLGECQRSLVRHPRYADLHNRAGICLALLDQLDESVAAFDRALQINPEYLEAQLNRAIVLSELGRYEASGEAFQQVAELALSRDEPLGPVGSRIADAHARLGDLYRVAGEHERASHEYRAALELRPAFLDIRARLGETYLALDQLARSRVELEAILERNPELPGVRLHLGIVHYRMGDLGRAREEWARCIEEDPTDVRARAYLAAVGFAESAR
ncbi:MAG: tetratricopeptide repeat protein [Gemmatimonadota bacterium]